MMEPPSLVIEKPECQLATRSILENGPLLSWDLLAVGAPTAHLQLVCQEPVHFLAVR